MILKVKETLDKLNMIKAGEHVVIGVSGGADSVALLLNLVEYQKYVNFTITVVHVNHMIRQDAANDAKFVEALCRELNLAYKLYEINIPEISKKLHMSEEEAGRKFRYDVMREQNPDKIAVGHHMDDLVETVLLNICRGSGIHGISGISPVNGIIIRPFLYVSREEIEDYLASINKSYCIDSTNLADDYLRNRIRHNVIPLLNNSINPNSSKHIANIASDMLEVNNYINKQVELEFNRVCNCCGKGDISGAVIDKIEFSKLDNIIKKEILLKAFERLTPHRKDITRKHIDSIIGISEAHGEKHLLMPYGLEVISSYNEITLKKRSKVAHNDDICIEIDDTNKLYKISEDCCFTIKKYPYDGGLIFEDIKYTKRLDYDKIKCSLVIRTRLPGDYIIVNDNGSRKSLKEYFINEKIPKEKRDKILLLADGNHILWIIGYRISAGYKINKDTKNIVEVEIKYKK